jgi:mono/diheme cytochrome c family protein
MNARARLAVLAAAAALAGGALAQPAAVPGRGQMLYETHCIACHSTQMHWRDQKTAKDWPGLRRLVRRWQNEQQLRWSDSDIDEVARYLNQRYYRYPEPGPRMTRWTLVVPLG